MESLHASVTGPVIRADLMFLASPGDIDQIAACGATGDLSTVNHPILQVMDRPPGSGDYALKINHGWRAACASGYDFVLLGADDLRFHPGWAEAALIEQLRTGACVIGTNDLGNNSTRLGTHTTHPLVSTAYTCGLVDDPDPGLLLNPSYRHNFVDNEFVGTAKHRRVYTHAVNSHVEHLHPFWHKAEKDATYALGQAGFAADRKLHERRRRLWAGVQA